MTPNRFREDREYLGFKPKEACRLFKITLLELGLLEDGGAVPSHEVLRLAVKLYGRPASWLLGDPEPQLTVPTALLDFARKHRPPEASPADMLELARFAQYLSHRAQVRGIA